VTTTVRPLTLDEAQARARLVHVDSYDIHLDLTRGDETFRSTSTIRFATSGERASTFVELQCRSLVSATLNGVDLPSEAHQGNRLVLDGLLGANEVVVVADIDYTTTGDGMHRFVDPADGEVYVGAYVGVVNAQLVFACFDQPDLKARIRTSVMVPTGWTAVGPGRVTSCVDGRIEMAATPPVSPYLFVLVAGPLHAVHSEHRGLPFSVYARASLARQLENDAPEILGIAHACYDHYLEIFDPPYPFDKYDQAFVPELNWGALEQVGCILLRDEYVYTSTVTHEQRVERANTIAHEMAHMWFGDLMTLKWWDDIWLNESFAELMGSQVVEEATTFDGAWTSFAARRKPWGYDADERTSTHPVAPLAAGVLDTDTALANFDGISYAKGASALRQLEAWLGREDFFAGINALLTERSFGVATLADLLQSLSQVSGEDVEAWADRWLRTTGIDTLRAVRRGDGLRIEHDGTRPHVVPVGLYDDLEGSLVRRSTVDVRVGANAPHADVHLAAGEQQPALWLVNDGDLTYAKVRLDEQSHDAAAHSLSSIADPLSRAVVWVSWRDEVRDGRMRPGLFVDLVERHLSVDDDVLLVDGVLSWARHHVADRYAAPEDRDAVLASLRRTCDALIAGTQDDPASSLRLTALRWQVTTAHRADAAELESWLADGVPGGPLVDDDLRWRILRRLAVLGAIDDERIRAELAASPTDENSLNALWCRASRPDRAAKDLARDLVLGLVPGIPEQSSYAVTALSDGMWQAEQAELLAPYVGPWLYATRDLAQRRGPSVASAVLWSGFPWHAVDDDTLALVDAVMSDPATTPATRRRLGDQRDEYARALRIRERDAQERRPV
jgi:aminopeptidase N